MPGENRFDYADGELDDVVVNDVKMFRLEKMNDGCYWLRCYCGDGYCGDGNDFVFWLTSGDKISARHEKD